MRRFDAHFPMFEISLQRATYGHNQWEAVYRYPLIGVSYLYTDLGNSSALGAAHAVFPFINFPLNSNLDNSLNLKLGLGLAYLTNKFDPTENFQNFAIGSHLNAAVSIYFDFRKKINRRSNLILSAGLTHFSNGSMKTPNFGLNILSLSAGYSFFLKKSPIPTLVENCCQNSINSNLMAKKMVFYRSATYCRIKRYEPGNWPKSFRL